MRTIVLAIAAFALALPVAQAQSLDRYLERARPTGPAPLWKAQESTSKDGITSTRIDLTSQVWRGISWTHTLTIYQPSESKHPDFAMLMVTGGGGDREQELARSIARELNLAAAVIDKVPNQPLFGGLREDALIAHSFQQFLETGDTDWPLLLPMTRSAVAGLDVMAEFSARDGKTPLKRFVITGGSKRGWTTWLTGIADPRVVGIAPIVYDNLNLSAQMKHQLEHWGDFSSQIGDYTARGLQGFLKTERGHVLVDLVDPWAYRSTPRFQSLPKLIINATNDAYWPVDALNIYWKDLGPQRSVLYVPNEIHGIRDASRVAGSIGAFLERTADGRPMPQLNPSYKRDDRNATITVAPNEKPTAVRVWTAFASNHDFRRAVWSSTRLEPDADGNYSRSYGSPVKGSRAFFLELEFHGTRSFVLSTPLEVLSRELKPALIDSPAPDETKTTPKPAPSVPTPATPRRF